MSTVFDKASEERRMFFAFAKCLLTPKARAAVAVCPSTRQPAHHAGEKIVCMGHTNNAQIPATPNDWQLIVGDRGLSTRWWALDLASRLTSIRRNTARVSLMSSDSQPL